MCECVCFLVDVKFIIYPRSGIKIMATHYESSSRTRFAYSVPNFFLRAGRKEKKILFRNTFFYSSPTTTPFILRLYVDIKCCVHVLLIIIIKYISWDDGRKVAVSVLLATRSRLLNDEIFRRRTMLIELYHFGSMVRLNKV